MYTVSTRPYCHADLLHEQIVRERTSLWKEGLKYQLVLLTTVVVCSLACVWARVEVVQLGYEISQANRAYHELSKENQHLLVEVTSLGSPSRIEAIATNELGFVHPRQDQVVIVP